MAEALKYTELASGRLSSSEAASSGAGEPPGPEIRGAEGITAGSVHSVGTWPRQVGVWNRCQWLCFHKAGAWLKDTHLSVLPGTWLHTVLIAPSRANPRPINCAQ